MFRSHACAFAAAMLAALPVFAQDAPDAEPADLPIRDITLYTSGVGFYQHWGRLPPRGEVGLTLDQEQIDDVLKSLRVWGGDGVPRFKYPVKQPLERRLASFGINIAGDASLPALLGQLRGVSVTALTPEPITGRILDVSTETKVVGQPETRVDEHSLVLVTEAGIRSIALDTVDAIQIENEKLQEELNQALVLLAESRDQRTKRVTIDFEGGNPADANTVGLSYLVEAPVWKTSYRLDLPAEQGDEATEEALAEFSEGQLQGWAIVENVTDRDWDDVRLTLISGRPISFVQDLYTPLYLQRPVVQPELYVSLRPKRYEGGFGGGGGKLAADMDAEEELGRMQQQGQGERQSAPAQAGRAPSESAEGAPADAYFGYADSRQDKQAGMTASAVQSAASMGSVGELFRYTLDDPISIPRQQSAMLPILATPVEAEPLSIYSPGTHPTHPLRGARLINSTDLKLMSGPITVYEDGQYLGDALIPFMGPGDERLVSYAVDLEVRVDPSTKSDSAVVGGRIVRGVLQVEHKHTWTQTYTINNEADEDKTLLIEHPRHPSRELIQPEDFADRTEQVYRFQTHSPANETIEFPVQEVQINWQRVSIIEGDPGDLLTYIRMDAIDPAVRDALQKAIEMKQEEVELRRQIAQLEERYQQIARDQGRINENMRRINNNSQLYQRYVKKLADQETMIEDILAEKLDLTRQAEERQRELADYLASLTVGE